MDDKYFERANLIYDSNCIVCTWIATNLKEFVNEEFFNITPNTDPVIIPWLGMFIGRDIKEEVKKDVHLFRQSGNKFMLYSGARAAVESIAFKRFFGWFKYVYFLCPILFKVVYLIVRKSKKYFYTYFE